MAAICGAQMPAATTTPSASDGLEHAQLAIELDAVAAEPHHRRRWVELGHEPGRMAGRPARQLTLLDEMDVADPRLGEVVSDAAAGDAAPNDDRAGPVSPIHRS